MSFLKQKTPTRSIKISGTGLHSGKKVNIQINPAAANTGIIFKRIDIKDNNIIYPSVNNVSKAMLCTTVTNEFGISVSTIEHLMGALFGMGVDNAIIEIDNEESANFRWVCKNFRKRNNKFWS